MTILTKQRNIIKLIHRISLYSLFDNPDIKLTDRDIRQFIFYKSYIEETPINQWVERILDNGIKKLTFILSKLIIRKEFNNYVWK